MLFQNLPLEITKKQQELTAWDQWYSAQDCMDLDNLEGDLRDPYTLHYLQDQSARKLHAINSLLMVLFGSC